MSRSADIDFSFYETVSIASVLSALTAHGVSLHHQGAVSYVLDDSGMFEWVQAVDGDLKRVIAEADGVSADLFTFVISVYLSEGWRGGEIMFHKGRKEVSFMATINRRHISESSRFCDFGWYLDRLVPALEPLGLSELTARDYK